MEATEYTGWRHGTSNQPAPPRKSKKKQNAEKKTK
jgi:hypothetical protein